MVNHKRVRALNKKNIGIGPILYWMDRDQRVQDNWALLYAQELAIKNNTSLAVVFCINKKSFNGTYRQIDFSVQGLKEVEQRLKKLNIPFYLLSGDSEKEILKLANNCQAGVIITDFNSIKSKNKLKKSKYASFEVDAHNIVPCWVASDKQEYAAYTIRPKINKLLVEFLDKYPKLKKQKLKWPLRLEKVKWDNALSTIQVDHDVKPVLFKPGASYALRVMRSFIKNKLKNYDEDRNNPTIDGQSGLSPYLHFGQISSQTVVLEVLKLHKSQTVSVKSFLEELIIRKELSDNFCYYNKSYKSNKSFPGWAQKTLVKHQKDKREYLYSKVKLEKALTHDDLWNAAQNEMISKGKMHGYMRMYWAKKILEWTKSAEQAQKIAIYLNDKYSLDGCDSNGYAGIAWSIGGVHDRPWFERSVFGTIRFMSYNGCKSKFDIKKYIKQNTNDF